MTTLWTGWAGYGVWFAMTVALVILMQVLPVGNICRSCGIPRPWLRRLLQGEMAIGGSVRVGLGVAASLWWVITAGVLVSDEVRAVLALTGGVLVMTALVNAGRRARLSVAPTCCLCAALSVGGVLLLMVSTWLWQSLLG